MPMTPQLRRGIDRIRDYLFGGGYPNPAQNAEQLSFLIYFYMYEAADAVRVRAARRPGATPYVSAFNGEWTLRDPRNAREPSGKTVPRTLLRWSSWAQALNGERLVNWVREEVFPFHAELAANGATDFMYGARLVIDEPTVLTQVVSQLNDLHLDEVDADTKGDLFEHVLRQIRQAGELGQFRTPRHVIRALVRLVDPQIGETVYDPAVGTAGFLVGAWDHIRFANSSPAGVEEVDAEGKTVQRGLGDMLSRNAVKRLQERTFYGADVDPQMVRLATMNLTLRGLDRVQILRRDTLTRSLDRAAKAELGFPMHGFDVILANPPFSGRLDRDRIVEDVKVGQTGQTELLFLQYMLNHLKEGGRCGVVVPEGVLFGSTGAHRELRRKLVENNTVEAVLSLPGGVFKPYAGVTTSVLVFRKGGATDRVMFLHAENDGFKLDANHDQPIKEDDLPDLIEAFRERDARWAAWRNRDIEADWTGKWWFAEADAIRAADFNLSANSHRPPSRAKVEHRDPLEILDELRAIETEILGEIDDFGRGGAGGDRGMNRYTYAALGDLCDVRIGRTPPRKEPRYWGGMHPWATIRDLDGSTLTSTAQGITDDAVNEVMPTPAEPNTLLFSFKLSIGKMAFAGRSMYHNEAIAALPIRNSKALDREFLFYALKARVHEEGANKAVKGKVLNKRKVEKIQIPLPPLDEQRRIVGILNRAAKIERLRARAQDRLRELTASLMDRVLEH